MLKILTRGILIVLATTSLTHGANQNDGDMPLEGGAPLGLERMGLERPSSRLVSAVIQEANDNLDIPLAYAAKEALAPMSIDVRDEPLSVFKLKSDRWGGYDVNVTLKVMDPVGWDVLIDALRSRAGDWSNKERMPTEEEMKDKLALVNDLLTGRIILTDDLSKHSQEEPRRYFLDRIGSQLRWEEGKRLMHAALAKRDLPQLKALGEEYHIGGLDNLGGKFCRFGAGEESWRRLEAALTGQ